MGKQLRVLFLGAHLDDNDFEGGGTALKYIKAGHKVQFLGRFTQDENYDFDMLRFGLNEWSRLNKYLTKDFYPITPWKHKTDRSGFTAHAYMDGEEGILLAFRMEDCEKDRLDIVLPFAIDGHYLLVDEDSKEEVVIMDGKLSLTFNQKRQARLLWVKKV